MKTQALTAAILITTAQFASAQGGGFSINYFDDTVTTETNTEQTDYLPEVIPQAPVDKFDVRRPNQNRDFQDTEKLKQSYDSIVNSSVSPMNLVAGKPNFIRNLRRKLYG
jgi:hypothetical protein